jgi:hypothetical protein
MSASAAVTKSSSNARSKRKRNTTAAAVVVEEEEQKNIIHDEQPTVSSSMELDNNNNDNNNKVAPEEQQQQPKQKKQKSVVEIIKIGKFDVKRDVEFGPISSSGQYLNSMMTPRGSPERVVLVALKDGGSIQKEFGVETSSFGGINVTLSLSESEHDALAKAHEALCDFVVENREACFKGSTKSDGVIRELANATVRKGKPRKNGGGTWPASTTVKVEDEKDVQPNDTGARKCKIKRNIDDTYVEDIFAIKGCTWTRAVIELRCVYIQSKSFGFSKRLRVLKVSPPADDLDIPSDSDSDSE